MMDLEINNYSDKEYDFLKSLSLELRSCHFIYPFDKDDNIQSINDWYNMIINNHFSKTHGLAEADLAKVYQDKLMSFLVNIVGTDISDNK